jgi:hypothetical protein
MTRRCFGMIGPRLVLGLVAVGTGILPVDAAYTGTGGGPETTLNAPYRSSVGQTLPPGRAAAPDFDPNARPPRQRDLDRLLDSICRGC